jgi:hypothetical protein
MTSLKINDGGAAFPYGQKNHTERSSEGMSLRDWFAGQAIGHLAIQSITEGWARGGPEWREETANEAYKFADAMIKAREKIK